MGDSEIFEMLLTMQYQPWMIGVMICIVITWMFFVQFALSLVPKPIRPIMKGFCIWLSFLYLLTGM